MFPFKLIEINLQIDWKNALFEVIWALFLSLLELLAKKYVNFMAQLLLFSSLLNKYLFIHMSIV